MSRWYTTNERLSTPTTPVRSEGRVVNSVSSKNTSTRVASPSQEEPVMIDVGINTTPCSQSSKSVGVVCDDPVAESLRKQIVELKVLHEAMVEQLIDKEKTVLTKERIIQEKEKTIETLMRQIHDMEIELNQKSSTSVTASTNPVNKTQKKKKKKNVTHETHELVKPSNDKHSVNDVPPYCVKKCSLIGDSHCRGLGYYLRRYLNKVESFFKPGSGFVGIRDSSTVSMSEILPEDKIIYLCGTNDVPDRDWSMALNAVDHILDKYETQQLCFILVPIRWDSVHLNNRVQRFNNLLRDKLKSKQVLYLDPNYFLRVPGTMLKTVFI
ncbi:hypothetical protein WDU94_000824 [Cyamophila willieti]